VLLIGGSLSCAADSDLCYCCWLQALQRKVPVDAGASAGSAFTFLEDADGASDHHGWEVSQPAYVCVQVGTLHCQHMLHAGLLGAAVTSETAAQCCRPRVCQHGSAHPACQGPMRSDRTLCCAVLLARFPALSAATSNSCALSWRWQTWAT
jgi:hypothetical protein